MSQLAYIVLLLLALLLGYLAKKKKMCLYLLIALLTFIAGFRGITCGVDTPLYYEHISNGFPYHWQFREEGFRIISNFFTYRLNNPQLMFVFCAFITNLLIILRLWDYKDEADFGFMLLLYILLYYSNSMNIMRQYVAVALIFYGTRYLNKNKMLFIAFVIAAFLIHRSSLLALGFFIISLWTGFSKKQKQLFFIPIIIILFVMLGYVAGYLSSDIEAYFAQKTQNLNITFFYILVITLMAIIFQKYNIFLVMFSKKKALHYQKYSIKKEIIFYVLIGLCFSGLSMFFSFVGRTGLYYSIFDVVFWGIACKKFKNSKANKLLILVYAGYVFGLVIFRNDCLLFPYSIYFY